MSKELDARRTVPLLDLHALHGGIREQLLAAITETVDSQRFILGDRVKQLEEAVARRSGVSHAIGCASGSDALYLSLLAIGIQPGDKVLTTPFTFFATAGSIARAGAVPVFADIDAQTYNIHPDSLAEALREHPGAKAVMPVHLFGACADMDPILELARRHGCRVIEDGAQSIGATYRNRHAQSLGDIGCISFFPSKNLGAMGDGGMMLTGDNGLAEKLAALRVHGSTKKYYHPWIGINSRLDALQAAVLLVKLEWLDEWTEGRRRNARRYAELLAGLPVTLPVETAYQTRHVYNQYVIRCPERDRLRAYMQERGIGTEIYYPIPLHLQPCFAYLGYREGEFPVSEQAAREVLALPVHSALSEDDLAYAGHGIRAFYAG